MDLRRENIEVQVGFVLFPGLTQLDLTGPLQVLHRLPGSAMHLLARTMEPVPSDCGLSLLPTTTFSDSPELDMLCIPGGFGVSQALEEPELMEFVRSSGAGVRYLTSVCTGAFILGVAGFLKEKRATTHWAYHHLLTKVEAIPVQARVVRDGQVITGGGVTAGIDFAFAVVKEVAGEDIARKIQVGLEYRPEAPEFPAPGSNVLSEVSGGYRDRIRQFSRELEGVIPTAGFGDQ